jgi:hypothetical protein
VLAAAAALAQNAPSEVADAFVRARLAHPRGATYGTSDLASEDVARLLDRALPDE